jgi:hypothetical protein
MKKTMMAVLVAVGTGTSAFCMDYQTVNMDSKKANISVEYSQEIADVKKMSEVLIVSPKNDQIVLELTTSSGDGSHYLFIGESEKILSSPSRLSFGNSPMQQLVFANPNGIMVHTDFANLEPFVSTQSYHDIHNGGYHISANNQTYKMSTFAFAANGAVQLNPQSPAFNLTQNPLLAMLGNHLSGANANTIHQPSVKLGCFNKSIKARPYGAFQRESAIDGTILYGDVFDMELSVSGIVLEFTPNDGFQFNFG